MAETSDGESAACRLSRQAERTRAVSLAARLTRRGAHERVLAQSRGEGESSGTGAICWSSSPSTRACSRSAQTLTTLRANFQNVVFDQYQRWRPRERGGRAARSRRRHRRRVDPAVGPVALAAGRDGEAGRRARRRQGRGDRLRRAVFGDRSRACRRFRRSAGQRRRRGGGQRAATRLSPGRSAVDPSS